MIQREQEVLRRERLGEVREVVLLGSVEVTSSVVAALARRGIDLLWLTRQGTFRARLSGPRSPQAALRLAQYQRSQDPAFAARLAGSMIAGKIAHQRQVLQRGQRRLQDDALADTLTRLRLLAEECQRGPDLDRLRGLEGQAAALYFGQLGKLVLVPDLPFQGRSRRPPRDPVNACLSFGYTLLGNVLESELLRCGLDPMLGFLHQPHHNRKSLALDLLEEMRPLVDTLTLRLINRQQLAPTDFTHAPVDVATYLAEEEDDPAGAPPPEGVYLNDTGRKIFLNEFYRRLREVLYYPPRQGKYALRDILREQGYHLVRVIEGTDAAYTPFLPT